MKVQYELIEVYHLSECLLGWQVREGFLFRNSSFQPNEMVFTICNSISRTYFRLMREIGKVQQIIRKLPRSFAQNGKDWSTNCERIFQKPLFHFTFNRNFQICWLNCRHSYCLWGNLRDSYDCLFIQHKLETWKNLNISPLLQWASRPIKWCQSQRGCKHWKI